MAISTEEEKATIDTAALLNSVDNKRNCKKNRNSQTHDPILNK